MFEIQLLNLKTNMVFNKTFNSLFLAERFLNKAKRSKQHRVLGTTGFY